MAVVLNLGYTLESPRELFQSPDAQPFLNGEQRSVFIKAL